MKVFLSVLILASLNAQAVDESRYFKRPLNCPLRFSSLSDLRDQVQSLVASLSKNCSQQAIQQLNSNVANLEGIANTFNSYSNTTDATSSAQYAKNVGQILGNINLITSNNACFYDIRSRGFLPVVADVIMSTSQLGLLVPSGTGQAVAAGGYIAGSGIKIISELLKKKFNFDKPEERRAFIQLNCAFFDNRRVMDESGIFNPETEDFRAELIAELRKERIELIRSQRRNEKAIEEVDLALAEAIAAVPEASDRGLDPKLSRLMNEIVQKLGRRPGDISEKLRQVSYLSENIALLADGVKLLRLDPKLESSRKLLLSNIDAVTPLVAVGAVGWTGNIDEYEFKIRGPLFAFLVPVSEGLKKEIFSVETEVSISNNELSRKITKLKQEIRENNESSWALAMRIQSIESKISSLENHRQGNLFSENDEGSSNAVEILDYYRKLQKSILGKEGRDYLKNSLRTAHDMKDGLNRQLTLLLQAQNQKEKCAAAEKTRFAWAQYRYKVKEAHDFVATNMDLYRSSFRIGKERLKGATTYVLEQMDSVQAFNEGRQPQKESLGELMSDVTNRVKRVEDTLRNSACF